MTSSLQLVERSVAIAESTLESLETQRETLKCAEQHVVETRVLADEARRVLNDMAWHSLRHKLMLCVVIFLLLGAIVGVGYMNYLKTTKGGSNSLE